VRQAAQKERKPWLALTRRLMAVRRRVTPSKFFNQVQLTKDRTKELNKNWYSSGTEMKLTGNTS
jgi:hypothetical protein